MILFTSDLDRTLIYSTAMMKKYPIHGAVTAIEYKDGKAIGFMSRRSIELLQQFHKNHLFVPVTTRAIYQYERIHAFQQWIQPKYAITSNGGTILVDGKPDAVWGQLIREKVASTALPKEDLLNLFSRIRHEEWIEKQLDMDGLFFTFHVNRQCIPYEELFAFEKEIIEIGWRLFLHGRKLYILPNQLNKAFAVAHLQNYVDYDMHVAAGDSLMDYDMLMQAAIGFSPMHGELFERQENDSKMTWLTKMGAASTEQLLGHLLEMTTKK
ncbi:HAD family hydrolase [Sporosarcina sp. YIM B06819]|uniref:HAD family hydrolase n=1 Tax=Sporosarcina sp. YIM B06819 TaxID=3081769 RepID=UPI00298C5F57|nr:HAD family hydrolase [Sporosarcina sp. YIM B06819]